MISRTKRTNWFIPWPTISASWPAIGLGESDQKLKIGIHEGPCLAVTLNDRQDYFGQTVNIAARVQHLATARAICTTQSVVGDSETTALLKQNELRPAARQTELAGLSQGMIIYEISDPAEIVSVDRGKIDYDRAAR
jgi:class 3 adenylate cyclase